ncbi:hypothetical protein BCR33DRAFT_761302 [Rhizoclosmatium globosum]|uniref:G8 domain-containing protein n=1 Tax=Rhizoclosmatium globosum TaxID=329046 RepID=A0A1Y2D1B3_9FUNG|nr:hypothetical protein BCR33DRAFT_761302 [Rhizoclosmatium globosum]|eukprot:ORY52977.1 hypothetical protein BCR33DRAFT_761302 [Rhizoclosmatium globosum]
MVPGPLILAIIFAAVSVLSLPLDAGSGIQERAIRTASVPTLNNNEADPKLYKQYMGKAIQNHWSEVVVFPRPDTSKVANENKCYIFSSLDQVKTYGTITINAGSSLVFDDANVTMHTNGILVNGGSLWLGSETCHLKSYITIVLHGVKPANVDLNNVPAVPVKGIAIVNGGTLDIHGVTYAPTWTRLAATALKGEKQILIQDIVNWEVGQTILITTTATKDSRDFNQNDVAVISSIGLASGIGPAVSLITLAAPLLYNHYGGPEYQAEVGLLSRRIVVKGDDQNSNLTTTQAVCVGDAQSQVSTWPCGAPQGYGGHIIVIGTAIGRASGLELFQMGQTNVMGRYPYHIHQAGQNGINSYLKSSSIHQSFFRCMSVHGSHNVTISNNVAYDITANCFYIEDGIEEDNTFSYNLAAHIHFLGAPTKPSNFWSQGLDTVMQDPVNLIVPTDVSAACFYITNPKNSLSETQPAEVGWILVPYARPLKQFEGNSAHSTGFWWGNAAGVYMGVSSKQKLMDYKLNPGRVVSALAQTCSTPLATAAVLIPAGGSVLLEIPPIGQISSVSVGTMLDRTTSSPTQRSEAVQTMGPAIYNTNMAVWQFLTHSDQYVPGIMQTTRNIIYQNCNPDKLFRFSMTQRSTVSGRLQSWLDFDGSASLSSGRTLMGSAWANDGGMFMSLALHKRSNIRSFIFLTADPTQTASIGTSQCSNGDLSIACPTIGYAAHLGGKNITNGLAITTNTRITGPVIANGAGWFVQYNKGAPVNLTVSAAQFPTEKNYITLVLPYPVGTTFNVTARAATWCYRSQWTPNVCAQPYKQAASLTAFQTIQATGSGDVYYFDNSVGLLYVNIMQLLDNQLGFNNVFNRTQVNPQQFTRAGLTINYQTYSSSLLINAKCTPVDGVFCSLGNSRSKFTPAKLTF